MALILNIDTAVDVASVCLAKDGKVLSIAKNRKVKKIMLHGFILLLKKFLKKII